MRKQTEKIREHYCDTCRGIREHYWIVEKRELACVNHKAHEKMKWCRICGKRIDTGECQREGNHTPEECKYENVV